THRPFFVRETTSQLKPDFFWLGRGNGAASHGICSALASSAAPKMSMARSIAASAVRPTNSPMPYQLLPERKDKCQRCSVQSGSAPDFIRSSHLVMRGSFRYGDGSVSGFTFVSLLS